MVVVYTHTFEIKTSDHEINGELEFDDDGIMSYKTNTPLNAMTLAQDRALNKLFKASKLIFTNYNGIDKIEIIKKIT